MCSRAHWFILQNTIKPKGDEEDCGAVANTDRKWVDAPEGCDKRRKTAD